MCRRQTVPQRRFRSENITLSLSANTNAHLKVSDIGTFTVWCQPFAVFFTRLDLPINVSIPTGVSVCSQIYLCYCTSFHAYDLAILCRPNYCIVGKFGGENVL